jgi:hypothetical protein
LRESRTRASPGHVSWHMTVHDDSMGQKKTLWRTFRWTFLAALAIAVVYFSLGHWRLFPNHSWNIPGFLILATAQPWSSLWFDQMPVLGRALGFELRNALTVVVIPLGFALNCAVATTVVVWLWHRTRGIMTGRDINANAS